MNIPIFSAAFVAAALLSASTAVARQGGPVQPVFPVSVAPGPGGQAPVSAFTRTAGSGARPGPAAALRQADGPPGNGKKSVGLAVIYSLLLPGMGELYAGDYGSGKYFTGADGMLWLGLGAVDLHARSMRDDARSFAALHAGFDPEGKDDTYFVNVGNFDDVYQYNEQVLRDRDAYKLYDPALSYWNWDSGVNRSVYRDQRVASDAMFNNTRFVVAALVANRVLSAINAARIVISGNREGGGGDAVEIGADVLGSPAGSHGIALTLTRHF